MLAIPPKPKYDEDNEFEYREDVRLKLNKTYKTTGDLTVPFGKSLAFTSAQGQVITFGYNADGEFTIQQDAATPFGLASINYVTTVETTLESSIAALTVDVTAANAAAAAAASSALAASTSATNAGNSATAATASSVSAQSVANRLLPERVSVAADFLAGIAHTAPDTATPTTLGTVVAVAGEGDVREFANITTGVVTRGGLPVSSGRTFRLTARMRITVDGDACYFRTAFNVYDSSWTHLGNVSLTDHDLAFTVADGWQTYSQETTSAIILAAWPTAVYVRGRVLQFNAANNTWQVAFLRLQDITSEAAAAGSATAASTSASAASTSASAAGTSATAANTSATNAATSAGAASTSATNAATSATTASGHAATASTQATNAANSATAAGGSATAAATSASTASTQATNAGNSATSAASSAVSAQSVSTRLLPDRPAVKANFMTGAFTGLTPDNCTAMTTGSVVSVSGRGDVLELTGITDVYTRGALPVSAGRTFRLEYSTRATVDGTDNRAISWFQIYDASWTSLGNIGGLTDDAAFTVADGWQAFTRDITSAAILGSYATAAYVRLRVRACSNLGGGSSGSTVQLEYTRLRDVTSEAAAAASAAASATSASAASTSATAAGTSATAANTSATNAATSAGAASTSATNASTSATTAAGHAATSSTQATNAANSAIAAQSVANRLLPDRVSVAADFTAATSGSPDAAAALSVGSVVTVSGEGDVREFSGARFVVYSRGSIPLVTGKTYRISSRQRVTVDGTSNRSLIGFQVLDASWAHVGFYGIAQDAAFTVADGWQNFTADLTAATILGVYPTGVNLRTYTPINDTASNTNSGATMQVATLSLRDVTSEAAAAGSAAAAATSATTASTQASNAATSATSASTQATNAATSASNAATSASAASASAGAAGTSATNASTSASNAAGSASAASTSATAAATSATNAGNSATAAATSASTASTQATNAGNSATSAASSAVTAQSVANRILPDRPAIAADFITTLGSTPDASTPMSSGTVVAVAGEGDVRQITGARVGIYTRGGFAVASGKTYRAESRQRVTVDGISNRAVVALQVFDVSWANLGVLATTVDATAIVADGWQNFSYERTAAQVLASFATAAYVRAGVIVNDNPSNAYSGATTQVATLALRDVTAEAAAAASATAASTSASSASTSATAAGTSATAANTSATNAATSAGAASTSATNAATSATTAAGHAATASSQAVVAARSASDASFLDAYAAYTFVSTIEGFTANHMTLTATSTGMTALATNTDPWFAKSGLSFAGSRFTRVIVDLTRTVARSGGNWDGNLYYSTSGHSYTGSFYKNVTNDPVLNVRTTLSFDMTALTAGTTDWVSNTITGLRLDLDNNVSGSQFTIHSIRIVGPNTAQPAAEAAAAATSASTASTQATNASNSATAASASAVAAKSTAIAQGIGPADFAADGLYYTNTFGGAASAAADPVGAYANISGEGRVLQGSVAGTGTAGYYLTQKYAMVPRAGRKYKLTARLRVTTDATGGGVLSSNFHVNGLSTTLVHGNPTFSGTAVSGFSTSINPINVASGWQTISIIYTLGTPSTYDAFWRPRLDIIRTGVGSAGGSWEVGFFRIEDVTDSEAAAASATAASTSASSASTSATGAGTSATAAATSATTAATQASNAGTSATNAATSAGNAASSATTATTQASNAAGSATTATTQASNASASATSASSSATLSATYANGSQGNINTSATFADNTVTTGVPTNWANWANATGGTRVTGIAPQPYAFTLAGGAAANAGIQQVITGRLSAGWHVLEADITLVSGALTGAGVLLNGDPASVYTEYPLNFATDPDVTGSVVGAGTTGRLYKFRKLINVPVIGAASNILYAMSHYPTHGSVAGANSITWHRCAIRVASQAEIEARAATNDVVTLTASVSTNTTAIATVDGKLSASYALTVDGGGRIASMKLLSNGTTSSVKFVASTFQIYNGTTDEAPFEVVSGVVKIKSANVGTLNVGSGGVTIQSGASGARIVMSNSVVEVYDASSVRRVRMGVW